LQKLEDTGTTETDALFESQIKIDPRRQGIGLFNLQTIFSNGRLNTIELGFKQKLDIKERFDLEDLST
jgi:hypothetical protein